MKLKESESKLETMLVEKRPENEEVPALEETIEAPPALEPSGKAEEKLESVTNPQDKSNNVKNNNESILNNNLKKVTNIENEQLNKTLQNVKTSDETLNELSKTADPVNKQQSSETEPGKANDSHENSENLIEIVEIESTPYKEPEIKKDDQQLNAILRKNILSCVEKVALIEEMKNKCKSPPIDQQNQVSACLLCAISSVPLPTCELERIA